MRRVAAGRQGARCLVEDGRRAGCGAVLRSRRASCILPKIGIAAPRSAICFQLGDEEVNKDRLYRGLDHLLAQKSALEAHLSKRCGELFAVQNEVLLYDVTSTYFEGEAQAKPARRHSAAIRATIASRDRKQVCIALVVTFDGFPLGYEVFAGNTRGFNDADDHRKHHGGPPRCRRPRLDYRSRHGQRCQSGLAAPDREAALHHRSAEVGDYEEVRCRACAAKGAGARSTKASRSSSRDHPDTGETAVTVPLGRPARQRRPCTTSSAGGSNSRPR